MQAAPSQQTPLLLFVLTTGSNRLHMLAVTWIGHGRTSRLGLKPRTRWTRLLRGRVQTSTTLLHSGRRRCFDGVSGFFWGHFTSSLLIPLFTTSFVLLTSFLQVKRRSCSSIVSFRGILTNAYQIRLPILFIFFFY